MSIPTLKLSIVVASLVAAPAVRASEGDGEKPWLSYAWQFVASTATGTLWFARKSDLDALSGDERKIWVKQDHSKDKTINVRETKVLFVIECSSERLGHLSWVSSKADGSIAQSNDVADYAVRMTRAVPESVGGVLVATVCGAGQPYSN